MKKILKYGIPVLVIGSVIYFYQNDFEGKEALIHSIEKIFKHEGGREIGYEKIPEKILIKEEKKEYVEYVFSNRFAEIDKYALNTPADKTKSLASLAVYLANSGASEIEKVRAIFSWMAFNISYDDDGYNSGSFERDYSATGVLKSRVSICGGYSNLFKALCDKAGIESYKIIGYSKGYGYTEGDDLSGTDHAWNSVKINDKWFLIDVTWASSVGENINGKLKTTKGFDDYWFCTLPREFIFTHLPEEKRWQLIKMPMNKAEFAKLPNVGVSFFNKGFNIDYVYENAKNGKIKKFVTCFNTKYPIRILGLPYTRTLNENNNYTFKLESMFAEEIALIQGNDWTKFTKDKSTFTTKKKLNKGMARIYIKYKNDNTNNWKGVLEYNVE